MARRIVEHGMDMYRAVLHMPDGWDRIEGPYNKIGTARARVAFWKNHSASWDKPVTGHVEKATVVQWEKI